MRFRPHHTAFTVRDMDESVNWYCEKMGFELTHQYNKHGMEITQLKLDEVWVELFCFGEKTNPLPDYRKNLMDDLHTIGTKHLCIKVEDLDKMIEGLKKKNVEFATELDTAGFGGRYIFIKDPNGILIELYQA